MKWITRDRVRRNKDKAFLFGDNIMQRGFGGQTKEMRDEPNTFGIPTKWIPSRNYNAYFRDIEFELTKKAIDLALDKVRKSGFQIVIIPADGIGTGLARLDKLAPKTFEYLQQELEKLNDQEKTTEKRSSP